MPRKKVHTNVHNLEEIRRALQQLADVVDEVPQNTFEETTEPGLTDDITNGWTVGSLWLDVTNNYIYQCIDSTEGAAKWKQAVDLEISGGGGVAGAPIILGNLLVENASGDWERLDVGADTLALVADSGESLGVKWDTVAGLDTTAIHDNLSSEISAITEKTAPVDADLLVIEDSAATNAKKRVQIGNLHPILDTKSLVEDPVDTTKEMRIDVGAVATATTRVLTMPDQDIDLTPGMGSFATEAEGTLAASALQNVVDDITPQLGGQLDVNGQALGDGTLELLKFIETASAINEITITNAATGDGPSITATGDDTHIDLILDGKGDGDVKLLSSELRITKDQNAATDIQVKNATDGTSAFVSIKAVGVGSRLGAWALTSPLYTGVAGFADSLWIDAASSVSGGVKIVANAAGGEVKIYTDGRLSTDVVATFNSSGIDLSGNLTISGDVILSDEKFIRTGTSDGSDNESIGIAGGGSLSNLRGSFVRVSGNEDGNTGKLFLTAGNVAGGEIRLSVGGSVKAILDENGLMGLGTLSPQKDFHISSTVPTIRLSDSDAATDQAVATLIEFYRGDTTNRVGFLGMGSASTDQLVIGTDYTNGELSFRTGANVQRLNISSTGNFDFQAGNLTTTGDFAFSGAGPHSIGGATDTKNQLTITGTYSPATGTAAAFFMDTTLNAVANQNTFGMRLKCTLVEASSGTHTHFNTLQVHAPTITAGVAAVTTASTLRIVAAPIEGTNNYALLVDAGAVRFDETLELLGALSGGGSGHDQFSDFVANEHIDWTSASAGTIDITNFAALQNIVEDTTPEFGGEVNAGAHTIGFTQQTATGDGTTTIDWKLGNKLYFTFGAQSDTFTFTAPSNPCNLIHVLKQDSGGNRTAVWPAPVLWAGGTAPTLSTAANAVDIVGFYWDGTNYHGVLIVSDSS